LVWLHTAQFEDFGLALRTNERLKADVTLFYVNIRLMHYIYVCVCVCVNTTLFTLHCYMILLLKRSSSGSAVYSVNKVVLTYTV